MNRRNMLGAAIAAPLAGTAAARFGPLKPRPATEARLHDARELVQMMDTPYFTVRHIQNIEAAAARDGVKFEDAKMSFHHRVDLSGTPFQLYASWYVT